MVRGVDQLLAPEGLHRRIARERRRVVDPLVAARPQARHLLELRTHQAERALGLEHHLASGPLRGRRGDPRAPRHARVDRLGAEGEDDRRTRHLGGDQLDPEQLEKPQLVLLGRAVQAAQHGLEVARVGLDQGAAGATLGRSPTLEVSSSTAQDGSDQLGGATGVDQGLRRADHSGAPSSR